MTALLRSDVHRILHTRWPWVVLAIVVLLTFAPALLMRWTSMGPTVFDSLTSSAVSLGGIEIPVALMAAFATCARADLGFDRTVLSALGRRGRTLWFAEKCVLAVLIAGVSILVVFVLRLAALAVSDARVLSMEPAWQVALWLGCTWLGCSVYAVLTVAVGHLTRNETVTLGFAALTSMGVLEGGLLLIGDIAVAATSGEFLVLSQTLDPWMPATILAGVGGGAATMLSAENAVGLAPAVRAAIVFLPLLAATFAVDVLAISRRDMA